MRWSRRRRSLLVTGGSGLLGGHLMRSPALASWDLVAPPSRLLDVREADAVAEQVQTWKPTAIAHLAYRRDDPRTIVQGSANVARAAAAVGARLVHLSTDLVFAGRPAPYTEDDEPTPIIDYGHWKAAAEAEVAGACPDAVVVRTSLIYATDTSSPPQADVEAVLAGRSSMRFFTDEIRCPVHAADLAAVVAELADHRDITGPLHVAGPDALSRADIAARLARWMGHDPARLPLASLAESGLVRPGHVVLDCSRARALGLACRSMDEALRR
jgi:dTDP-4-dehydrorhamnose reductase